MASPSIEDLPPPLDSTAEQPPLFDGTTRLYTSYSCPYAQRVWITRNYKGLHDKIKLVPLNLQDRPTWYKEKVYPVNKVPALEHNNKIIGESLDLIKYDPAKREFAEELFTYTGTFTGAVYTAMKDQKIADLGDSISDLQALGFFVFKKITCDDLVGLKDCLFFVADKAFDHLETSLGKFDDGPFFLGQFSLVDIAFIPFVERFQICLPEFYNYDMTAGRPKLKTWLEECYKVEAYKPTKCDAKQLIEFYKARFQADIA
ncbi:Glutathione S-transferase, N-terminal [Dillenia turbinata]|uniref:Glutathione S-transferase, N-terminal n=1 Tax=Dillenia turbinata TaxID=194707 RepID=A0AAN8W6T4_9MAGN